VHYTPHDLVPVAVARERFGLAKGDVVYFCAQSLYKYLPHHDPLYPAIARAVPSARFVFIAHASQYVTDRFLARLGRAFAAAGLDARAHVVMVPPLPTAEFHGLAQTSDVFLDNPEWSGCNTSLEAMAKGLPAITLPGQFMRGRHTFAFLKMMGLHELIASDMESYVTLAVRMGLDAAAREEARQGIAERLPRLYGDLECVRALERFIEKAVAEYSH
jgi:predicted O-linked N-acetylglucosamine transferase (SPINDLY family)